VIVRPTEDGKTELEWRQYFNAEGDKNPEAMAGLARVYIDSGNEAGAADLINSADASIANHPEIAAVRSQLTIAAEPAPAPDETAELKAAVHTAPDDLDARLALAKALAASGRNGEAVEHLLYSIGKNRAHNGEAARLFLLTIFEAEGPTSEVSVEGRRALSSILFS